MFALFDFLMLASSGSDVPTEGISLGAFILYSIGIVFFLLLNAFFVAAEFAIVKVRPSQLETESKEHPTRAATAIHVVNNLDGYLSANQLGITIASLAPRSAVPAGASTFCVPSAVTTWASERP